MPQISQIRKNCNFFKYNWNFLGQLLRKFHGTNGYEMQVQKYVDMEAIISVEPKEEIWASQFFTCFDRHLIVIQNEIKIFEVLIAQLYSWSLLKHSMNWA